MKKFQNLLQSLKSEIKIRSLLIRSSQMMMESQQQKSFHMDLIISIRQKEKSGMKWQQICIRPLKALMKMRFRSIILKHITGNRKPVLRSQKRLTSQIRKQILIRKKKKKELNSRLLTKQQRKLWKH